MALERRALPARRARLAGQFRYSPEIEIILSDVYGSDAPLWMRRWRWFFLATAGLFGYAAAANRASAITG